MIIKDLLEMFKEQVLISAPVVGGLYRVSIRNGKLDLPRTYFESFSGRKFFGIEKDFLNREIDVYEILR